MSATEILRRDRQRRDAKRDERAERRGRKLIRPKEAMARLGVGKTRFWEEFVRTGRLRLVHLGPRSVAALEDELDELIDELVAARDAGLSGNVSDKFVDRHRGRFAKPRDRASNKREEAQSA